MVWTALSFAGIAVMALLPVQSFFFDVAVGIATAMVVLQALEFHSSRLADAEDEVARLREALRHHSRQPTAVVDLNTLVRASREQV